MRHSKTIIVLFFIIKNIPLNIFAASNPNELLIVKELFYASYSGNFDYNIKEKFDLWRINSFFRGTNIHPYKLFTPFLMRLPITRDDIIELKKLGANLVVANFPGIYTYFPSFEIDSLHLKNLDRIVQLTADLKINLIISIRSGPGRSLYTFFDKMREDEFVLSDSMVRNKYIEMCRLIVERYKSYEHLVGINFFLEPHSDDPVNINPIDDSIYYEFIEELINEVRKVDLQLPIIVQPMGWAYPDKFLNMKKFTDQKIVYSFDMYFPHSFTNEKNDSSYPGYFYIRDSIVFVDSNYLKNFLQPVLKFKEMYNVPIFVNEYGGIRTKKGFITYLRDLHRIFLENGFHFAYYVWKSEWGEFDGNSFDDFNYEKGNYGNNLKKNVNELMEEFKQVWRLRR